MCFSSVWMSVPASSSVVAQSVERALLPLCVQAESAVLHQLGEQAVEATRCVATFVAAHLQGRFAQYDVVGLCVNRSTAKATITGHCNDLEACTTVTLKFRLGPSEKFSAPPRVVNYNWQGQLHEISHIIFFQL